MKRKSITALLAAIALAAMMLSVAACREKNNDNEDPQPEVGVDHQFDGEVVIPPGAVREVDEEWSQTFEIDENNSEHRFIIGEIIDEPEEND